MTRHATLRHPFTRTAAVVLAALALASCGGLRYTAMMNPTVHVNVEHPPNLGLGIATVTFSSENELPARTGLADIFSDNLGLSSAVCGAELQQRLTRMLLEEGLEVTRRDNPAQADVAIAINVTRCDGEQERSTTSEVVVEKTDSGDRRRPVTKYHAHTRVFFRALFEVTDLSTGNVMLSRSYEFEPRRTNVGNRDYPDYPSANDVIGEAYRRTTRRIRPLFFGWTERRELVFFDDDRCGLKQAFRAVEVGDYERALRLSIANVDSCQPEPQTEITTKDVAAAHYNVGILHRIRGDFGPALASLEQGRAADPDNGVIRSAIREAISARAVASEFTRAEQDATVQVQEEAGEVVTNDVVIGMFEDGLEDEIIIEVIKNSEVDFDVSPATLGELRRMGLSPAVISAMIAAAGGGGKHGSEDPVCKD